MGRWRAQLAVAVALGAAACTRNPEPLRVAPVPDAGSLPSLFAEPVAGAFYAQPESAWRSVPIVKMPPLYVQRGHVGAFALDAQQWKARCHGVRTSYNPDSDLRDDALTLRPSDPRWLDFVFWSLQNKINEHQLEAYGGTGWNGPKGGVIFHWAPGSRWEGDTLMSFAYFIGHVVGEHRWSDTMFPDFFEKYGGVYGINIKDRLAEIDPHSSAPWVAFLEYAGGATSPYFRDYLHVDARVDVHAQTMTLTAGQGVAFDYSFARYYHELATVLTDCRAVSFFQMYDRFGPGFAAEGDWAQQGMSEHAAADVGFADRVRFQPGIGSGGAAFGYTDSQASAEPAVPPGLPEAARMRRGRAVYAANCEVCHGASGDGAGFLAEGFAVKPRDFRQGIYLFRSTKYRELPAMADLERSIRDGIPGTTMPAWGQFLSEHEIGDVARYLVVFSPRFTEAWRAGARPKPLKMSAVPPEVQALDSHPTGELEPCGTAAAQFACAGEKLFRLYQCAWCHGDHARGDGQTARQMRDGWGNAVRPANLTYKWLFKNGHQPQDVYRTIFGGLNGTPMQSYAGVLRDERQRWELVGYVLSLSPPVRPVLHLDDYKNGRDRHIGADGLALPAGR